MIRFLFRTVFRLVRLVVRLTVRLGLLVGLGLVVVKLLQGRRASQVVGGSASSVTSARRSDTSPRPVGETPLVRPHMFEGVSLKRGEPLAGDGGQDGRARAGGSVAESSSAMPEAEEEAPPAALPKKAAVKKAVTKKAVTKKAAVKKAARKLAGKKAVTKKALKKASVDAGASVKVWVDPNGDICPTTHPVKGKMSSRIYHLPGMTAYERTSPDRCYRDEAAAEAEGLRRAKR